MNKIKKIEFIENINFRKYRMRDGDIVGVSEFGELQNILDKINDVVKTVNLLSEAKK